MNVPKILINKPIMHILIGTIVGILTYLFWNENQWGTVIFAVLFIIFLYNFYELNYFKIIMLFFIMGYISIFAYFNLVGNRYGVYNVRITDVYQKYSIGSIYGRKVYVNSDNYNFEKNEVIKFKGKFKRKPEMNKGIVGDLFVDEVIERKKDWVYKIRDIPRKYNEYVKKYVKEEDSAVLTALTFGNKEFLSKEERENFKALGIIHLICISGFHIAMVYEILKRIIGEKIGLLIGFFYVILTGLTPSALRAFIMISCLALTTTVFKKYDNKNALGFSAILLLIIKPVNIIDVGFHLSYLATIGILLLYNFLNRGFYRVTKFIRGSIALSFSAQLFIFPYMLVVFKSFSLNFLIGSLLLTPIISIMLPVGLIVFLTFLISIDLKILELILRGIFIIYNLIIEFLNYIAIPIVYGGLVFVIGYMLMLICFYMSYKKVSNFKFKELGYFFFLGVIIGSFNLGTTISVFQSNWNKGIIIKKGFYKEAYTSSNDDFFKEEIKKEYALSNVNNFKKEHLLKLDDDLYLCLNNKIEHSFIMLKKNKYDIIDLLKKEKRLYHKGKFIYIDERGTK